MHKFFDIVKFNVKHAVLMFLSYFTYSCKENWNVGLGDLGSHGPWFESCWRQNSAYDCASLDSVELFINTLS